MSCNEIEHTKSAESPIPLKNESYRVEFEFTLGQRSIESIIQKQLRPKNVFCQTKENIFESYETVI